MNKKVLDTGNTMSEECRPDTFTLTREWDPAHNKSRTTLLCFAPCYKR